MLNDQCLVAAISPSGPLLLITDYQKSLIKTPELLTILCITFSTRHTFLKFVSAGLLRFTHLFAKFLAEISSQNLQFVLLTPNSE